MRRRLIALILAGLPPVVFSEEGAAQRPGEASAPIAVYAARDARSAADGNEAVKKAPPLPRRETPFSAVDCDPSRESAPPDAMARYDAEQAAQNPDAEGAPAEGARPELPGGGDLAKALVQSAKTNCVPRGSEMKNKVSVGVTPAPATDGNALPTLAPRIGVTRHF